jgi:hypothetical protein
MFERSKGREQVLRRPSEIAVATLAVLLLCGAPAGADHSVKELISDQASAFPEDDVGYGGISTDGEKVFFELAGDVYERSAGATTLVSRKADGSPSFNSRYAGATPDGSHVYFESGSQLTLEDTDSYVDLYQRAGGVTTLISTGPLAGNANAARFEAVSEDGSRVFFNTREALVPEDDEVGTCVFEFGDPEQGCADVYERSSGTTKLVSTGPTGGTGNFHAGLRDISAGGAKAFFSTNEALTTADSDTTHDAYERSGGTTRLVTTGPADSGGESLPATRPVLDVSRDGEVAFFDSFAKLTADDDDTTSDIYARVGGTSTVLISAGGIGRSAFFGSGPGIVADDGSRVYFASMDRLTPDDDDLSSDFYGWNQGTLTLHSTSSSATFSETPASGAGSVSADGSRVFFRTAQKMVAADTDSAPDVYERSGGTTTLISTGPADPGGGVVLLAGISRDGTRAFLITNTPLVASDTDDKHDLYERFAGVTTLISVGPAGGNGPEHICMQLSSTPTLPCPDVGFSDDGRRVFFTTRESLLSQDTDQGNDVYGASAFRGYARPKGATPLRVALVPAFGPCLTPDRTHGAPLALPSCSGPSQASPRLTVGTPDANGQPVESIGAVRLRVAPGDLATAADEADVQLDASLTDVRQTAGLSDYSGELQVRVPVRTTDRANAGTSANQPGTSSDTVLSAAIPCTGTTSGSVGSTCSLSTTIDALVPGAVAEGRRATWQVGQIEVHDGGADGVAGTPGNAPFARQGIFIP